MKVKTKVLNSIYRFASVMIVLCILPLGAFASENKPAFTPGDNITDENFTDVQAEMLDSISEQISELQSFYTNVSEASSASDLQEVLSSQKCAGIPHAFPAGREGEIQVNLRRNETSAAQSEMSSLDEGCKDSFNYILEVSDNGKGIPKVITNKSSNSLGLQLVNILVEQIDGCLEIKSGTGTQFTIWFNNMGI